METFPFVYRFHDPPDKESTAALQSHRPILTHLNADTSWLLQLPCPHEQRLRTGRSRYNIVIDPWFQGPQVDFAAWISKQWHAIPSRIQNFQELESYLKNSERISPPRDHGDEGQGSSALPESSGNSLIDAIIVSHEYTDHCHKETLLELHPTTPIFATSKAAALIKSWKHFMTVSEITLLASQGTYSVEPLPGWLGVSRVVSRSDPGYLHSAILLTFKLDPSKLDATLSNEQRRESVVEGVVYTPHGIRAQDLRQIHSTIPSISILALLHGFDEVTLSRFQKLNLGAHNGLKAHRICKPTYWVSTHDEAKPGSGLVSLILRRKAVPVLEALEREILDQSVTSNGTQSTNEPPVIHAELDNGACILLR